MPCQYLISPLINLLLLLYNHVILLFIWQLWFCSLNNICEICKIIDNWNRLLFIWTHHNVLGILQLSLHYSRSLSVHVLVGRMMTIAFLITHDCQRWFLYAGTFCRRSDVCCRGAGICRAGAGIPPMCWRPFKGPVSLASGWQHQAAPPFHHLFPTDLILPGCFCRFSGLGLLGSESVVILAVRTHRGPCPSSCCSSWFPWSFHFLL